MEVVVPEEKKKIFRARKTMKLSDRLQLESLHSTLLTTPGSSNPSPPPLMNGTHKEDGQKTSDKEQNNISDSNSPAATSPASPTSLSSPTPFLSLNLSPSPASSESPKPQDEASCPNSPLSPDFADAKKTEDKEKENSSSSSHPNDSVTPVPSECKDQQKNGISTGEKEEKKQTNTEDPAGDPGTDSSKEAVSTSPAPPSTSKCIEPMETETNTTNADDSEASTSTRKDENPSCSSVTTSITTPPPSSGKDIKETIEIKEDDVVEEEEDEKPNKNTELKSEEKMEVDKIQSEFRKETKEDEKCTKPARPSSTPPSNSDKEGKSSTSGLKRTLSEGDEKDDVTVKKEGKRPKMEHEEVEAHLKLEITAKAGSQHKLEKIVQQLVNEQLQILELVIFDKHFKELKDRVDKVDCATKHQTAINTLQSKISRLVKKFGEANQASENKKKQEALAAATTAAAAAAAAAVKPPTATNTPQAQRQVRTSIEVKQIPATVPSSNAAVVSVPVSVPVSIPASIAAAAPSAVSVPTPTSTTMVPQGSILQLITSNANAASTLATGITTQSQPGTLVLKTTPGSGMVTAGQPLVIQLPLSVNGQPSTLVNFPVSSLSAASSLNKAKTTPSTTTFILKSPPSTNAVSASTSTLGTLPTLQASTGQLSTTQFSVARTVYQGGASRITTPNAGVSVTTVRAPAQSVSVAGALSSAASPATSGPAATGSTAPGTPQGTSLTSKTDNQVAVTIPSKPAVVPPPPPPLPPPPPPAAAAPSAATPVAATAARPKGSVIDLTEDDDDVQVTGVKNATVTTPSSAPRPNPVIRIPDSTGGARSSPKTNLSSTSSPQVTVHHRPPLDSSLKPRTVTTTTASRGSSAPLPPLPFAPAPLRLPPEAEQTSPPQQLQLKLVPGQTGIVLSWSVSETDRSCAAVDSYHLYAFHQDNSNSSSAQQHWKKIGEVNALPLPMACTLTQFQSGSTYYFAVRAKDIYGRFGAFCEPQCTNVISSGSS